MNIVLTRKEEDVNISNIQRVEIANKSNTDLCIEFIAME